MSVGAPAVGHHGEEAEIDAAARRDLLELFERQLRLQVVVGDRG
jgi:hypothetical protein